MTKILPLKGVKIVEMSNMVTASLSAMMLAGQGAEVIKVEPLGIGDKLRHFGSMKPGLSAVFNNCNRGKRSLAINLKTEAGQEAIRTLILETDVLLHNYRPNKLTKLGLGRDALRIIKPELIICSLTGFGRTGPLKDAPAFDHVIQALAGLTGAQGKDGNLEFINMLICDKITAYTAAQAVTAALFHKLRTGEGQVIDISMLQASLAFMWPDGMMHNTLLEKDALQLAPMKSYYQTFKTKDGYIATAPFGDEPWQRVFKIINRPDLAADPRYKTLIERGKNVTTLLIEFEDMELDFTSEQLLTALQDADIPCAPCLDENTLLEHPQVKAVGAIEEQTHPYLGRIRMATAPVHFGAQVPEPLGSSPQLGQHSAEVLAEVGYDTAQIEALKSSGII